MDKSLSDIIIGLKSEIKDISLNIYRHPETAMTEHNACAQQVEYLRKHGFAVENPAGKLKTAYKAVYKNKKGPVVAFISEYDALPGLGHACGHNLISALALSAAAALKIKIQNAGLGASVLVMGTPAEESHGGKIYMIEDGLFKGIDLALMAHPFEKTSTDPGWISVSGYKIKFTGKSAHASGAPEQGINALDAVQLLFAGVNTWRQQLPETSRVHGIVTNGGIAPNIIPDTAECEFFIRADNEEYHKKMEMRFMAIVKGAALMTECKYKISESRRPYRSSLINKPLNDEFFKLASGLGMNPEYSGRTGRVSTDFGDVSQIIPGASFMFGVTSKPCPLHSIAFEKEAGMDYAFEQTFKTAEALAEIGLKFIEDASFRKNVKDNFLGNLRKD